VESTAPRRFAPSLRASVSVAANGVFQPDPKATFVLAVASVDGCPARFAVGAGVSLRACVGIDLGILHATGNDPAYPSSLSRNPFWLDLEGFVRGRWEPTSSNVFFEAEGGLLLPMTYTKFQYEDPTLTIYPVPKAAGFAGIGVGLRFP